MTRIILWAFAIVAALAASGLIYVRAVPSDPAVWHVDPLEARRTGRPNDFLVLPPGMAGADAESPLFDATLPAMARRLDQMARSQPRVTRLAGSNEAGFITFVARSRLIGFPDYVSVKVMPQPDGRMALAIWSRSRFGYSDAGVNRARVEDWLSRLASSR
jgi:hypothetical protein